MENAKSSVTYDNKGTGFFMELGSHLQLEIQEASLLLKSDLIGMEVDKYLIAKVYQMNDNQEELIRKNKIIVKYFHKNSVLGFQSNAISIISKPEKIVFLEYPKEIENFDVRAIKRTPCFLPVKLKIDHNIIEGVIIDINGTGCSCEIKDFKITNEQTLDKVSIHLQNSKLEYGFTLLGNVKSVRHKKDKICIGIMFVEFDGDTQVAIQAIVPTLGF